MTDREIKLELAKAALGSESHNIETVKHFYKWIMESEERNVDEVHAEYNCKPIGEVVAQIKKGRYNCGYAIRLERIFRNNNIKSVGDLLRFGRTEFSRLNEVGKGSLIQVDDALEELYGIKSWYK